MINDHQICKKKFLAETINIDWQLWGFFFGLLLKALGLDIMRIKICWRISRHKWCLSLECYVTNTYRNSNKFEANCWINTAIKFVNSGWVLGIFNAHFLCTSENIDMTKCIHDILSCFIWQMMKLNLWVSFNVTMKLSFSQILLKPDHNLRFM